MKVTVLGAGNGGHAMAAHLTIKGHDVVLFTRTESKVAAIEGQGGIVMEGAGSTGLVRIAGVTTDISSAIDNATVIISTVPGMVQPDYFGMLAPFIRSDQALWFCPGNAMSLIARPKLAALGTDGVLLIESNTLTYAVRTTAPAAVKVTYLLKPRCAAFPASRNPEALELVRQLYELPASPNVLDTTLNNVNPMIHVAPSLLNMGPIDARDRVFSIYGEGMTDSVLRTMKALDSERLALLARLGLDEMELDDLYEELGTGPIYKQSMGVGSAERFEPRFLSEDVPVGLVTMASLAQQFGTPSAVTEALITLASTVDEADYWRLGRTLTDLGMEGMSVEDVRQYLLDGRPSQT